MYEEGRGGIELLVGWKEGRRSRRSWKVRSEGIELERTKEILEAKP